MSGCARLVRVIPTKAARCCSTLRRLTAGRRCWRWPMRWSAGSTGGPGRRPTRAARSSAPWRGTRHYIEGRPAQRPSRFADAGTTLLRTTGENEIWCRCDGGPHGYLSIAAHAHADALSVEVRYAGVDILADPGTYCYHGERAWRSYFRSTIAHNTAELGGRSQSSEGGPFMWVRHAHAREIEVIDDGDIARWTAEHDGYASLDPPALHRRSVLLDRASRSIDIIDEIEGGSHDIRLAFHLGPEVQVELGRVLRSPGLACAHPARERRGWNCRPGSGGACTGVRLTPSSAGTLLAWDAAFPPLASSVADVACPARLSPRGWSSSKLDKSAKAAVSRQAVSWSASGAPLRKTPEIQAEAR